jgi:hypothetical protein
VKLCVNNRLIDIKHLVTLCNDHSASCIQFRSLVHEGSAKETTKDSSLSLVKVKKGLKERRGTAQPGKVYRLMIK